ncbi:MAM and LDL-receptor class A domain-containing protein 2 [Caerostris extrusa]|uniref:MAM and LDL-receptor class A domain-containing protein 2 n=1 Tax=Caerostris extrusa TaxID=172846 RepID=A0AAV4MVN5_CAEEX|nr:MAM and LDL-receptor class A domain-containing protein 2 [Caerostris extrusa]
MTRPRTDHTTLSTSGHYVTLNDDSKRYYFSRGRLFSQDGIDENTDICFRFWYHMYGNNPGSLYVKVQNFHDEDKSETIWTKSKSQGDGTWYGDISLDDFSLVYGTCPPRDFVTSSKTIVDSLTTQKVISNGKEKWFTYQWTRC